MSSRRIKLPHERFAWEDDIEEAIDPTLLTAAFFGLKPIRHKKVPANKKVIRQVVLKKVRKLYREGYRQFLTGICGEYERGALEALLELRERHPDARLILVLGKNEHLSVYSNPKPILMAYRTADSVVVVEDRKDRIAFALMHSSTLVCGDLRIYARSLGDSVLTGKPGPNPSIRLIDTTEEIWKAVNKTDGKEVTDRDA